MPKKPCDSVEPEALRSDTKKLSGKCADRTNCYIGHETPKERAERRFHWAAPTLINTPPTR